jgi:hypothetical protein
MTTQMDDLKRAQRQPKGGLLAQWTLFSGLRVTMKTTHRMQSCLAFSLNSMRSDHQVGQFHLISYER